MNKPVLSFLCLLMSLLSSNGETLEKIISLEDPRYKNEKAVMTVGLDGRVYLTGTAGRPGYVMVMNPDGSDRRGGDVVYAVNNATADADGTIAVANHHFSHSVNIHNQDFEKLASNNRFANGDKYRNWRAPQRVEAAPSGDFYALDQNVHQVVRLDERTRVQEIYPLPENEKGIYVDLRISEKDERFYLRFGRNDLHAVDFAGNLLWEKSLVRRLFTTDENGTLYFMQNASDSIEQLDENGEVVETFALDLPMPVRGKHVIDLQVHRGKVFIKRNHPTELFLVFDLKTGKRLHAVQARHRKLTVEYPGSPWTAGADVPFDIRFASDLDDADPQWSIYGTALGDNDWQKLNWENGVLSAPTNLNGLMHLRVVASDDPDATPDLRLDGLVELREADSQGTVSVWTPDNRIGHRRGETVELTASLRSAEGEAADVSFMLEGPNGLRESVHTATLSTNGTVAFTLSADKTQGLAPGRYRVVPEAEGWTGVGQPLRFGPFTGPLPPFRTSLGGDYMNNNNPSGLWDFADTVADHEIRARSLGFNQFFNRTFAGRYPLNMGGSDRTFLRDLQARLSDAPDGVDPAKTEFGFAHLHSLGMYGGLGLREWVIIVNMDAGLPLGTGWDKRTPEQFTSQVKEYAKRLHPLPAVEGFNWSQNWWIPWGQWFPDSVKKDDYLKAHARALETGEWASILDEVGEDHFKRQTDAQAMLESAMNEVAPELSTAGAGAYRRPEIYPPINFSNVDEVSLHFQSEQIAAPNWTAHAPDFYHVKGKPRWMHPELMNEDGTGDHLLSFGWLGVMRGVDGVGTHRLNRNSHPPETEMRTGYHGVNSVMRQFHFWLQKMGPWLTTLENRDRIAIAVSERMIKIDGFHLRRGAVGARYFSRLYEAYNAFLTSGKPATFVYAENLEEGRLPEGIEALVLVSQEVEPGSKMQAILDAAREQGIPIYIDGNSRADRIPDARPLGVAFDKLDEKHAMNEDTAWIELPEIFMEHAQKMKPVLEDVSSPVVNRSHPEVMISERGVGDLRVLWVVNNAHVPLPPGVMWRVATFITPRLPADYDLDILLEPGEALYEVFDRELIRATEKPGLFQRLGKSDATLPTSVNAKGSLRGGDARLFVIAPEEIGEPSLELSGDLEPGQGVEWTVGLSGAEVELPVHLSLVDREGTELWSRSATTGSGQLTVPENVNGPLTLQVRELITGQTVSSSGTTEPQDEYRVDLGAPRLRDVAVSRDGKTALINAFEWGDNLYQLDLASGEQIGTERVGHYQAFAPVASGDGFYVQGYDLLSAEGYHSYSVDADGGIAQRFAMPGIPLRMKPWAFPFGLTPPQNQHAVAEDGSWLATAGNIGIAVWSSTGERLWTLGDSEGERRMFRLAVLGDQLLVAENNRVSVYTVNSDKALKDTPDPDWTVKLPWPEPILGITAEPVSGRLAVWTESKGGRTYVIQNGKTMATIPGAVAATALSPNGPIAMVEGEQVHVLNASGAPMWTGKLDSQTFFPEFSQDGKHLAVVSSYGELRVYDVKSSQTVFAGREPAVIRPQWLKDGDLLTVGWLGEVTRRSPDGDIRWQRTLERAGSGQGWTQPEPESMPTFRWTTWINGDSVEPSLEANLLSSSNTFVSLEYGGGKLDSPLKPMGTEHELVGIVDGEPAPPEMPYLNWRSASLSDSGWRGKYYLIVDSFGRYLDVDAVTFVEDPDHPESWLRDMRLEVLNEATEKWEFVAYLTSDSQVHRHTFQTPVKGSKFRFTAADLDQKGWMHGNLRLGELIFEGRELGSSHPDVVAERPVAVLFDEQELDRLGGMSRGHETYTKGGAFSGGTFIRNQGRPQMYMAMRQRPFGNRFRGWDFVIAENPKPGEYRWLQFAIKGLDPETASISLRPGTGDKREGFLIQIGDPDKTPPSHAYSSTVQALEEVPTEWTVVRVDVWDVLSKDDKINQSSFRIRDMLLASEGGESGFDQILLGQTEEDLMMYGKTKVACVGDSITFGTGIEERETQSYPAVLQNKLGDDYLVRNYGAPGHTMLKEPAAKFTVSYWNTKQLKEALAFNPDVVVLMLGTNDSWKDTNWALKKEFARDYLAMLDRLEALPSKPRIILCVPPPGFEERPELHVNQKEMATVIQNIGKMRNLEVIDLYAPLGEHPEWFPDACHPNAEGAAKMADIVYEQLVGEMKVGE